MPELRRFRHALALLLAVLFLGVCGYAAIEGWSFLDAGYQALLTLTTSGGEVHPLSRGGRAFTMLLLLAGVGATAYVAASFTQLFVTELLGHLMGKRRMERDLARLSDHYIVCGWGRMGEEIAQQFLHRRLPFVIVEPNETKCLQLVERGLLHVQGNGAEDEVLAAAGVNRARGLIAVAATDADNIFITLSARSLNRELFIVARSVHERDAHKLEVAGANRVISPYVIGARRIAAAVFHPTVSDFLDQEIQSQALDWELGEVTIGAAADFAGRTLRECGLRERTGCTVLAVQQGSSGQFAANPPPDTVLRSGDTLVVVGTTSQLGQLEALAGLTPRGARSSRGINRG